MGDNMRLLQISVVVVLLCLLRNKLLLVACLVSINTICNVLNGEVIDNSWQLKEHVKGLRHNERVS